MEAVLNSIVAAACQGAQTTLDSIDCAGVTPDQAQTLIETTFTDLGIDGACPDLNLCGSGENF